METAPQFIHRDYLQALYDMQKVHAKRGGAWVLIKDSPTEAVDTCRVL
jgi:hypothetical protein